MHQTSHPFTSACILIINIYYHTSQPKLIKFVLKWITQKVPLQSKSQSQFSFRAMLLDSIYCIFVYCYTGVYEAKDVDVDIE